MDIETFCSVLADDNPAGPDLEYDQDFLALEQSQRVKEERQFGDTIIPAEPPDWKLVLAQASALGQRTRDLRVACAMTRALTHLHGLGGLACGMRIIDRLCRDLWAHVFPMLDESDGNDPTLRMNALAPLASADDLLADIRSAPLVAARGLGSCCVRDLEIGLGVLQVNPDQAREGPSLAEIEAMVAAACNQGSFDADAAQQAIDITRGLQSFLSEQVAADAPNLQPLVLRLKPIADFLKRAVPQTTHENADAAVADPNDGAAAAAATVASSGFGSAATLPASALGEIRSSKDAARMLDLVCAYFEKHEPTNPAPLLLRRAQRLATMNFYDIVRDIAPDALSSVELVAGHPPEQST